MLLSGSQQKNIYSIEFNETLNRFNTIHIAQLLFIDYIVYGMVFKGSHLQGLQFYLDQNLIINIFDI